MASKATVEKWLRDLTHLPTASGLEDQVVDWVEAWVGRRDDLTLSTDTGGNLLITQKGRKRYPQVLAVAHMDHPAFVITDVEDDTARFEFRGSVDPIYFAGARIRVVSRDNGTVGARVVSFDPHTQMGDLALTGRGEIEAGDIAMWMFPSRITPAGLFSAPACDDLAGCVASLAALDKARGNDRLRHFGVLLTRAEEVGLIGAIHAAREQTVPLEARLISIETSRELPEAPLGDGPIIRTGDRSTVFDREMTNRISRAAATAGIPHQRKLMSGGGCEATAFGAYGYRSSGLCLALRNWHNRGNLDQVERGKGRAIAMQEEISLEDFHGLVDLILVAAEGVDMEDPTRDRLERLYEANGHYLD